ncbi:MAG: VacJ family lipoprotein [Pseudomonadota bacterium]
MKNKHRLSGKVLSSLVLAAFITGLSGCATVANDPRDPWEGWNRGVQTFNDKVDQYAMKPVAKGYRWITPSFVDRGVTNFFSNIDDIGVTINDLLQFKLKQGGLDAGRFVVNTVAGVAGFVDVASMINLPKHNEDFGQTLGAWGVATGPYLVLPFFGPNSPRDTLGLVGDAAMNPVTYVDITGVRVGLFALKAIDTRADNLGTTEIADEAAVDRYEFYRDSYIQRRRYLVYDGNPPIDGEEEYELDEEFESEEMAPVKPF